MTDRYEEILDELAHEIWAVAQLAPGEGIVDGVDRIAALLRKEPHLAMNDHQTTHAPGCWGWGADGADRYPKHKFD